MKYEIVYIYPNMKALSNYYESEKQMKEMIELQIELGKIVLKEIKYKNKITVVIYNMEE